jgi:hypothetical protein
MAFALAVAVATPNPFSLAPFPTQAPALASPLPEIGRVRSATPACAVIRDLVAPAYAAALRADGRFAALRKTLPKYVDAIDDAQAARYGSAQTMMLAKLDREADALREEAMVVNRALSDPRLAKPTDPQVILEKRELEQLYARQSGRANVAWEFVMRQRVAIARSGAGMGESPGFATMPPVSDPNAMPAPAPLGQPPPLHGNDLADKNALEDWAKDITVQVRTSMHQMAQNLLPIANSCR